MRSDSVRKNISLRQTGAGHNFYSKQHTEQPKKVQRIAASKRIKDLKPSFSVTVPYLKKIIFFFFQMIART